MNRIVNTALLVAGAAYISHKATVKMVAAGLYLAFTPEENEMVIKATKRLKDEKTVRSSR